MKLKKSILLSILKYYCRTVRWEFHEYLLIKVEYYFSSTGVNKFNCFFFFSTTRNYLFWSTVIEKIVILVFLVQLHLKCFRDSTKQTQFWRLATSLVYGNQCFYLDSVKCMILICLVGIFWTRWTISLNFIFLK